MNNLLPFGVRPGRLTTNDVVLETHEYVTLNVFLALGKDIELIPPSNTPGNRRPDFLMDGLEWEMKCPQGKSRVTIEHAFKRATRQSSNIVIDLRRHHIDEQQALTCLKKLLTISRRVRHLKVITREQEVLDLK